MADQRSGWPGICKVFCCMVPKDSVVDPPQQQPQQQQPDGISESCIDPENNDAQQTQAVLPERMHQVVDMPSQDIEEMYLRQIYDLEQELHTTRENNKKLSHELNEMGRLVFPELADCTQFNLIERLKVYLECQLMEKQDLERRVIEAEAAKLEMENAVAVLQRQLQNADYSSLEQMDTPENDTLVPSSSPVPMEIPIKFSPQFYKRSPKKVVTPTPEKPDQALHNEENLPKQKIRKDALAKIHQEPLPKLQAMAGEEHFSEVNGIPTEQVQKQFQKQSTGSSLYLAQFPRKSTDESIHTSGVSSSVPDGDVHAADDYCFNMRSQDFDTVSTTSTLPATTPSSRASDGNYETLNSSDNPKACSRSPDSLEESKVDDLSILSNVAALPVEERHETQGEMVVRDLENGIATKKPMSWVDPTNSQKLKVQAGFLDLASWEAKSMAKWKVPLTHAVGKDASWDDMLDGVRSLPIFVHESETKMRDLASETSQAMSVPKNPETASSLPNSSMLLAKEEDESYLKRGEDSSLEESINLPSTSIKTLETTQIIAVEKMDLKGPSTAGDAKDELCTSSNYSMVVSDSLDAETGEMCSSPSGPTASEQSYVEFHKPTFLATTNIESLTKKVNCDTRAKLKL